MNIQQELESNARRMQKEANLAYKNINKKYLRNEKTVVKSIKPKRKTRYIYCLLLEGNHFYIGQTTNVQLRFIKHQKGKGSSWTKIHRPVKIIEFDTYKNVTESECVDLEDNKTQEYADKYGTDKVRGGRRCSTVSFFINT